jgi:excisionase family DNA binding protein
MPSEIVRRWIRPAEAAERMSLSVKRIYGLIAAGRLPHSRPPGIGIRVDWLAVERGLEKHTIIEKRKPR